MKEIINRLFGITAAPKPKPDQAKPTSPPQQPPGEVRTSSVWGAHPTWWERLTAEQKRDHLAAMQALRDRKSDSRSHGIAKFIPADYPGDRSLL